MWSYYTLYVRTQNLRNWETLTTHALTHTHTHTYTHTDPHREHNYFTDYYRTHSSHRMFSRYYCIYSQYVPQGNGWQHTQERTSNSDSGLTVEYPSTTTEWKIHWYILLDFIAREEWPWSCSKVIAWTCTHTHTHTFDEIGVEGPLQVSYPSRSIAQHTCTPGFTVNLWARTSWVLNCWGSMW